MTQPSLHDSLRHAREATEQIGVYLDGMTKADFLNDKRTQQAVILNLIILGEAATKLMDQHQDWVAARPAITWRSIRGMRNRIAHGYYDIDLEIVWETGIAAIPELSSALRALEG